MSDRTPTSSPAMAKADEIVAVYRYDIHPVTVPRITTAIALALDEATARVKEECAETCLRIWREAPNVRTDSVFTSYQQNAIGPGCVACAEAIRAPTEEPSND